MVPCSATENPTMTNRPDDAVLKEVAAGAPPVLAPSNHPVRPVAPLDTKSDRTDRAIVDWRTIDPATIQGEGIPVEELRFFIEIIDEMLRTAPGQYVLI